MLSHGTGFCAAVWHDVAVALADEFVVYAWDRRGHGASHAPADAYHLADFAEDAVVICEELDVRNALAVGHSAGATDLLIAAARRPERLACVLAIEPTAMNPFEPPDPAPGHDERPLADRVTGAVRRRTAFDDIAAVVDRYRGRGIYASWPEHLLRLYVEHGFGGRADGSVEIRCRPEHERIMLNHIFSVMDGTYRGDRRGNPLRELTRLSCPVTVATNAQSEPVYHHMAAAAMALLPHATRVEFPGTGHTVAQESPGEVSSAVRSFWSHRST
ncbi:MAG: alpha/beta hydrolase [Ilumatobacteraceae bacterium]